MGLSFLVPTPTCYRIWGELELQLSCLKQSLVPVERLMTQFQLGLNNMRAAAVLILNRLSVKNFRTKKKII